MVLSRQDLFDDFMSFQVSFQSHLARQTKGAVQGAPHLCGYAQCDPSPFGNQHALDGASVFKGQKKFPGPIARLENPQIRASSNGDDRPEGFPIIEWEVSHLVNISDPALVHPPKDLPGPILGPPKLGNKGGRPWKVQSQEIYG